MYMKMEIMIIIIDLHCDASLPLGASDVGGGNKYSRNLLSLLISKSVPFSYFTIKKNNDLEEKIQLANHSFFFRINLENHRIDDSICVHEYKGVIIKYIESILSSFEKFSFVFHSIYWTAGELATYFANKFNSYYIHTVVSNGKTKQNLKVEDSNLEERCSIEQKIFEQAKYIICSSKSEAREIEKNYNICPEKLIVTGRWIEQEYLFPNQNSYGNVRTYQFFPNMVFHYIDISDNQIIENESEDWWHLKAFLYVGRIHYNKGITQILEAWNRLYRKYNSIMPPLWLVGGTPSEISAFKLQYLENSTCFNDVEQQYKLIWWGSLSAEGISTLMSKSLALIMHSKYEAGGNVILEAMAHKLPIIATPYGYAKDYVHHSQNGYLVEYDDIDSLVKYMEYFIKQPYLTNYMGRVAACSIRSEISNNKFSQIHLKLYGLITDNYTEKMMDETVPIDSIDTYLQKFEFPETSFLYYLISKNTNFKVLSIKDGVNISNYYLWEIVTTRGTIFLYFLYSILNRKCLAENNKNYIISKQERILFAKKECLLNKVTIYFIDEAQGYILLNKKVKINL